jgi:NaMN:DMB phosphoribosyltransferase
MKVRRATRNMAVEPAMTMEECRTAIVVGTSIADKAAADEIEMIAVGEMGIGNTTAAAALLSSLTGLSPDQTVGMGTAAGLDHRSGTEIMETKKAVITRALALHDHYVENGEPREEEENGDDGDDDADTDPRVQLAFRKLQTFGGVRVAQLTLFHWIDA